MAQCIKTSIIKNELVEWKKLKFIQDIQFKKLDADAENRLKKSFLEYGFLSSFKVWQNKNEIYCIDGFHRITILNKLLIDGYSVEDKYPAEFIDCKNIEEAAIFTLIYSSEYAKTTQNGLKEFINKHKLDFNNLNNVTLVNNISYKKLLLDLNNYNNKRKENNEINLIKYSIKIGDIITINNHKILCGDSSNEDLVKNFIANINISIVFTDPPYDMCSDLLLKIQNICKEITECHFWMASDKQQIELVNNNKDNFKHFFIHDFKAGTLISNNQPISVHNLISKFGKKKMNNLKDGFSTILQVNTMRGTIEHKSFKMGKRPELSFEFIIHYTEQNDIIFDPFLGTASTLIACEKANRICYGIELDPENINIALNRIKTVFPLIEIKINGEEV